jgi:F-type H+-transporting ATPase subunit delta
MHAASRVSLAAARERFDTLVDSTAVNTAALSDDLFGVAGLLDGELGLRRALSEPASSADAKIGLLTSLLGEQVSPVTLDLLSGLVRTRWSSPQDLVDAVEILAVQAEVVAAEQAGRLDEVEDELFRFGRILEGEYALRAALADRTLPVERKRELLDSLLRAHATDSTRRLLVRLVTLPRGRTLEAGLEEYAKIAADRRSRLVARVRAAAPLTEEQKSRLASALAHTYGRQVHLNVDIDPTVIGGLSVAIGDEIIDGTIASRIDDARRRMAS